MTRAATLIALVAMMMGIGFGVAYAVSQTYRIIAGVGSSEIRRDVYVSRVIPVGTDRVFIDLLPTQDTVPDHTYTAILYHDRKKTPCELSVSWTVTEVTNTMEKQIVCSGLDPSLVTLFTVEVMFSVPLPTPTPVPQIPPGDVGVVVESIEMGVGQAKKARIRLIAPSGLPAGLSGFTLDLHISNGAIAEVVSVTSPLDLASFTGISTGIRLSAVDLGSEVNPGDMNVLLAEVSMRGRGAGDTVLHPTVIVLDDDNGNDINALVIDGGVIVR